MISHYSARLFSVLVLVSLGCGWDARALAKNRRFEGAIVGANLKNGHLLRTGKFPPSSGDRHARVVIVGGGISGLSAAWWLEKKGATDYLILEMENQMGGNSRGGSNRVSPYPWGAHYVTLPSEEAVYERELFEELGVITGYRGGLPVYEETYLCADPEERLYLHGRWQEGLLPQVGASPEDRRQYEDFFERMTRYRLARGKDGRRAFCIPVEISSRDPKYAELDKISMAEFMDRNGWKSPYLRWYVDYCCRDDYGTTLNEVSAWAGIHYFSAHRGRGANAQENAVLTWPEGNAWLANRLVEKVGKKSQTSALVYNIEQLGRFCLVDYLDLASGKSISVHCETVIFAAPRFVAAKAIRELREKQPPYLKEFTYAPWVVANVTVDEVPKGQGASLAWDNVFYGSASLGYVVATHQNIARYPRSPTVLTYYHPLTESAPSEARQEAMAKTYQDWCQEVAQDLGKVHPGIIDRIKHLDVWIWGHGMIRPVPGFVWGQARAKSLAPLGAIFFANSDMSGLSLFEEAQFRGVEAAKDVLRYLKPQEAN